MHKFGSLKELAYVVYRYIRIYQWDGHNRKQVNRKEQDWLERQ